MSEIGDFVFYDEPIVKCPVCGEFIGYLCDITSSIGGRGESEINCEACGSVMTIEVDYTWSGVIKSMPQKRE